MKYLTFEFENKEYYLIKKENDLTLEQAQAEFPDKAIEDDRFSISSIIKIYPETPWKQKI